MKRRKYEILLLCILTALTLRLCFVNHNVSNNSMIDKEGRNTIDVWKGDYDILSAVRLENEKAKAKAFDDRKKNYMKLYPDMYVESIKPVIQLERKKVAYLTFDDGPSYITSDILNTLDDYEAKATFFILGCTITEEGEECLKEMVDRGHTIGIHTYSHNYRSIYSSVEAFLDDFYKDYLLIYETTGVKVNIFRFPWGSYNSYNKTIRHALIEEMERRGFTYYDWNISAEDSVGNPTEYRIKKNVLKDLERYRNPIILMHDAAVNHLTARTLPDILESMMDNGYIFDTLDHREPYQFGRK